MARIKKFTFEVHFTRLKKGNTETASGGCQLVDLKTIEADRVRQKIFNHKVYILELVV